MSGFRETIRNRNPVWAVPSALPLVLFGSRTLSAAVVVSLAVLFIVPLTHAISFWVERHLSRDWRIMPPIVIAAALTVVGEPFLTLLVPEVSVRLALLLRALCVTGIVLQPVLDPSPQESFQERMVTVAGLVVGFLVGFAPYAAARIALLAVGYRAADSLVSGFLLFVVGKIVIEAARRITYEPPTTATAPHDPRTTEEHRP